MRCNFTFVNRQLLTCRRFSAKLLKENMHKTKRLRTWSTCSIISVFAEIKITADRQLWTQFHSPCMSNSRLLPKIIIAWKTLQIICIQLLAKTFFVSFYQFRNIKIWQKIILPLVDFLLFIYFSLIDLCLKFWHTALSAF